MKKFLMILLVAALLIAPATAASFRGTSDNTMTVALNLGTNTGVGMKFGLGDFDILANVGFDFLNVSSNHFSIGADVGLAYQVADFDFGGGHHMPLVAGVIVPMSFILAEKTFVFGISPQALVGVEYMIPDTGWLFYARLGLGVALNFGTQFDLGFGASGAIGAGYQFDLN
ncbi:MAG TPA: hypothetical protein IAB12_05510 [Candidatus Ornithospirochaeta avicola]|uniref:Outer membrane protein beta-barrel domain-containing protein n=1 Tax=Candidatus Ornithospirochaeta avicola TaxID=2840896 RepID=A0A9D1PTT7_9SPIO|nr:hypothetical protein [Candidatus Ornithospirochaeta avicola]